MARRSWRTAVKGTVYATEWPEWHVDCADPGCGEMLFVSALGEAMTVKEAEVDLQKVLADPKQSQGWTQRGKLCYCPKHTPKEG